MKRLFMLALTGVVAVGLSACGERGNKPENKAAAAATEQPTMQNVNDNPTAKLPQVKSNETENKANEMQSNQAAPATEQHSTESK